MSECENCNAVYSERNKLVALVYELAQRLGYKAGIREHAVQPDEEWDPEWHKVVLIDLPTGQVSWHIHSPDEDAWFPPGNDMPPWDGHTTEEKYKRVLAMVQAMPYGDERNYWKPRHKC